MPIFYISGKRDFQIKFISDAGKKQQVGIFFERWRDVH